MNETPKTREEVDSGFLDGLYSRIDAQAERIAELEAMQAVLVKQSTHALLTANKRIAELEAMLKLLEWAGDGEACGPSICPVCYAVEYYKHGHADDCALAALLPKEAHDE